MEYISFVASANRRIVLVVCVGAARMAPLSLLYDYAAPCSVIHAPVDEGSAMLYCSILSIAYVGSLYVLVPVQIRHLDRDDARQIRWRGLAALLVSMGSILSYSWLFCSEVNESNITGIWTAFRDILGATGRTLLHTVILYMGPIITEFVRVHNFVQRCDGSVAIARAASVFHASYLRPTFLSIWNPKKDSERWVTLRNLVVAPLTEEVVFRACMVPVLEAALGERKMPARTLTTAVSIVAPLFFGFAHVHHAVLKLRQGQTRSQVLLATTFQFAYTSIFGAYVSYVYLRTRCLTAIVLCHAFCNAMGLPDLSFLSVRSPLYSNRRSLSTAMAVGLSGFILGMTRFDLP